MMKDSLNNKILILLFVGVLMGALDLSIVGPVIPAIENSMNIHGRSLSWIFSIYLLFYLFGILLMSKLSDVYGRRIIYILCLVIFGLGATIVALSDNLTTLLIGRAIQGFGSSGVFPVAAATIGDLFPVTKRGKALGLLGAVYGVAFILGPIIAGSMLHFFSWNAIFLINLPIVLVLIIFSIRLLPGKPVGNQKDQILTAKFLKSNQLRLVGLIALGLGVFQSSIVFLPKLAVEMFQVSPSKASFMLLPLVLSTAIIPPVTGLLLNQIGSRTIVITGLIFAVISLFLFSLLEHNRLLFFAAEAGLGVGLAIRPSLKYIVLNEIGTNDRASTVGMLIVIISIGQIAGASLIGVIISESKGSTDGFFYAFVLMGFVTAVIAVLSFFLKNRRKELANIYTE